MEDTNLNLSKCIVTKVHVGYDTMVNICNGKTVDIDWAAGDWAAAFALSVLLLFMLGAMGGLISLAVSDLRGKY